MKIQRVLPRLLLVCFMVGPVLAQQSPSAQDYLKTAVADLKKGDLDNAINDLTQAIELDPRNVSAFFMRAQCYFVKGNGDNALLDYNKVIELAPSAAGMERAYNNRGVLRMMKGDKAGALNDLEQAVKANPGYADGYSNRGLARSLNGDDTGAAADYEKALELSPSSPATYINRGIQRFGRGNFDGAMADFNRAIELSPTSAKPYVDRGVLHTFAGETDLAIADIKKAISLDATSLSEKDPGFNSSPFKRLQTFISSNPNNARGYEARGILRLLQGRREEAKQDFTRSVELNSKLRPEIDRLMAATF
jgi:tetratricopeptide (TPR) repeat protein